MTLVASRDHRAWAPLLASEQTAFRGKADVVGVDFQNVAHDRVTRV